MRNVKAARFVKGPGIAGVLLLGLGLNLLAVQVQASPAVMKDWTLLVFLNGKNNLDDWALDNLLQMQSVGSTDRINVVVEWGDMGTKRTERLFIAKDAGATQVTSPVLQDMGTQVDMGDWRTLSDFVRWGVANYPARHYFIDVWDHGTGWHPLDLNLGQGPGLSAKDISHDEVTGHWINTQDLAHAISDAAQAIGRKVDIYASDACEMGMIEIATEMKDSVDLYGGSEIEIPTRGWPYDVLLSKWDALPAGGTPLEVAKLLTTEMVDSYIHPGVHRKEDASFTFYDLSQTGMMNAAIGGLTQAVLQLGPAARKQAIDAATESTEITSDYDDFLDFANRLESKAGTGLNPGVFVALHEAASKYIIAHAYTDGYAAGLKGISIWFPREKRYYNQYLKLYQELGFSTATHWDSALPFLFLR